MDLKSGIPYWLIRDGLLFDYSRVESLLDTEVVILGGGISGALSAYYLTEASIQCIVVDSRNIGQGSTCASTSLLQYEIDTPLCRLEKMIGGANAARSYRLCAEAIRKLGSIATTIGFKEFEYRKSLYFAACRKDVDLLKEEYQARKQNDFEVVFLDHKDLRSEFKLDAPAAILSFLGAETDAYAFTHAIHQHNLKKGCQVFDRTGIKKIRRQKDRILLTTENNHIIRAKYLIYATGYESADFLDKGIITLASTYAIISENKGNNREIWKDNVLIWNTAHPYLYLRTTRDGRIIAGGRDEPFYNPAKRDRMLKQKSRKLELDFRKLFPGIPFKKEYEWTGTFGSTKDGLPFIGPHKAFPNSFFSLGFGGNGIVFSQIAGEINRDLILGRSNVDVVLFSFERKR